MESNRLSIRKTLTIILLFLLFGPALTAQVKIVPGEELYLNPTNPGRSYYDVVIHNVVIAAENKAFTLDRVVFEFMVGSEVAMTKTVRADRIVNDTRGMDQMINQGMTVFFHGQLLSEQGLESVFDRPLSLGSSQELAVNEALILTRQHFSFDFVPNSVRVRAIGSSNGNEVEFSDTASIVRYQNVVKYTAPLKGTWLMASTPSIESHHRLNPATEFALDFFKPGPEGTGKANDGDAADPTNFLGYGEEVYAAAPGEVVFVIDDVAQDRSAFLPKEGESRQQANGRIQRYMFQRMMTNFRRAAAGNIIVIKHEANSRVEYSAYGHLKSGSVQVAVGDKVERAQLIAEVGDTGDTPVVHLHFQVNTQPDPFFSRSLPVGFTNFGPVRGGTRDLGRFVVGGN